MRVVLRRSAFLIVFGVLVPAASACDVFSPDVWEQRGEALERSRERWQSGTIQSYRYTFTKSCFCIPAFNGPVDITVSGGEITSLIPMGGQETVTEDDWPAFDTVEELFALIERAIDERAHRYDVEYDPVLGYPATITLDMVTRIADDEVAIRITDLQVIAIE